MSTLVLSSITDKLQNAIFKEYQFNEEDSNKIISTFTKNKTDIILMAISITAGILTIIPLVIGGCVIGVGLSGISASTITSGLASLGYCIGAPTMLGGMTVIGLTGGTSAISFVSGTTAIVDQIKQKMIHDIDHNEIYSGPILHKLPDTSLIQKRGKVVTDRISVLSGFNNGLMNGTGTIHMTTSEYIQIFTDNQDKIVTRDFIYEKCLISQNKALKINCNFKNGKFIKLNSFQIFE